MATSPHMADGVAVLDAFAAAWNRHDQGAVLRSFADDAVVHLVPGPRGVPETYAGREQLRSFVARFIPGGHLELDNIQATSNRVIWTARVVADPFRRHGVELTSGTGDVELAGHLIQHLTLTLDAETAGRL